MTGFYTFKWERPASEVYVTGTFDGWSRSTRLEKADSGFVKKVELPVENILYKFIVDGNWIIDPNAPIETEPSGVQNSILFATKIEQPEPEVSEVSEAIIETVAPESTTVALAAEVPKEAEESEPVTISSVAPELSTADIPEEVEEIFISSVAPESTTTELAAAIPISTPTPEEEQTPTLEEEQTPTLEEEEEEEEEQTPTPKEEEQVFSVNPLPASETAENPITLIPEEPVPKDIGTQSLTSNIKLDKESYEQGATNFPVSMLDLPDVSSGNLIPESSLPIISAAEAETQKDAEAVELPQSPAVDSVISLEQAVPETPVVEPIVTVKKLDEEEPRPVFLQTRTLTIKTNVAPDTAAPISPASMEYQDVVEKPSPNGFIKTEFPPTPTESYFGSTNRSSVQSQGSSISSGKKSTDSTGAKKTKHRGFFGALREKLHLGRRRLSSSS